MRKRFRVPKLVYVDLCFRLQIDLVDPTHEKRETHTFVTILGQAVVIQSTWRFLGSKCTLTFWNHLFFHFLWVFRILNNTQALHYNIIHVRYHP